MRFTTRDLLWLMLVFAVFAGWLVSVRYRARQFNAREARLLDRVEACEAEQKRMIHFWDGAQKALDDAEIEGRRSERLKKAPALRAQGSPRNGPFLPRR
jgi:hypothetical protein